MVFCSKCGSENKDSADNCEKCGEFLLKKELFEAKNQKKFEEIFTEENFNALNEITVESYFTVLTNIINMGFDHLDKILKNPKVDFNNSTILTKIVIITQIYAQIVPKPIGGEFGEYRYNSVLIDERMMYESDEISTLIHELSHHIFSEILEQLLMNVWECDKSDALEAFAWFTVIKSPNVRLINEYCAHTCQGRFIPYGHQRYGSFYNISNTFFNQEKDKEIVHQAKVLGNSIAQDIIQILGKFITPNLCEEIKGQFKRDYPFPYNSGQVNEETHEIMTHEEKIGRIINILTAGFNEAKDKSMEELEFYKNNFINVNQKNNPY